MCGSQWGPELLNPILHPGSTTLSVSVTPSSIDQGVLTETGVTAALTATPSGGLTPYTHSWTILSQAGTGTLSVTTPTASSTTIGYLGLFFTGAEVTGTVQYMCTDRVGQTAFANISVRLEQEGLGSGGIP